MTEIERKKYDELLKACEGNVDRAEWEFVRWKCVTDLYYLGTVIFGLDKAKKRVHPPFHRWLCSTLSLDGDKMILVPRKHTKTTWTEVRIVQLILKHSGRVRILMLSLTERLVTMSLAAIKRMLAREIVQRLFPEIVPAPGKDYKNWKQSTINELKLRDYEGYVAKEPQIMAYGSAAAFTGSAVDYIFLDDYIDDDTCRSATKMQKAEDDWRYLQPILDDGEVCITGTFYHYADLYNLIIKEGHIPRNRIFIRPAIENGKILFPTMFNERKLDRFKKILGNYIFHCQYLLNPVPKEDQIFPGPQPICQTLPADHYKYYIVMDPAATVTATSDETGAIVAAVNDRNVVYYVEAVGFKKDGPGKADWLIQKCLQYKPEKVGIELGLQQELQHTIRARVSDYETKFHVRVPMNIEELKITNKQKKADRIHLTLGSFVRQGKVQLVEGGCKDLINQMDTYTGKGKEKDDVVDAAALLFPLVGTFGYQADLIERIGAEAGTFFAEFAEPEDESWRGQFSA